MGSLATLEGLLLLLLNLVLLFAGISRVILVLQCETRLRPDIAVGFRVLKTLDTHSPNGLRLAHSLKAGTETAGRSNYTKLATVTCESTRTAAGKPAATYKNPGPGA